MSPLELYFAAARAHGQESEPEMEVGDLQMLLIIFWDGMTEGQRTKAMAHFGVKNTMEQWLPNERTGQ